MQYLSIKSLPKMHFAHTYGNQSYLNEFKVQSNVIEITYISKGAICFTTSKEEFHLKEGSILVNTYTCPSRIEAKEYHEHHTVSFRLDYDVSDSPVPGSLSVPTAIITPKNLCRQLIDEIIRTKTLYADSGLKTAGLVLQLLYELSTNVEESASNFGNYLYIKKLKNYVFQHIHEPIRQTDIAGHLGITPEYLCSIFKQCENTTVMSYINRMKLEGIRNIMENEHLPLCKAAELYGYSDPNYVSRLYKKIFHANITDVVSKN